MNLSTQNIQGERTDDFLSGGGELGALMREIDWSRTSLGPPQLWPQSLKTCIRIMLTSQQPIWVGWGEDLTYFYNDAYKAVLGDKHPAALGLPIADVWREIWPQISARILAARGGDATYSEAEFFIMERHGYREETYFTFSFSPIFNDDGGPGGIICANTDETQHVIGERRIAMLRELSVSAWNAQTVDESYLTTSKALAGDTRDIPFALLYQYEPARRRAILKGTSGIAPGHRAAPQIVQLDQSCPWPIAETLRTNAKRMVTDLTSLFGDLPKGNWDTSPLQAAIIPLSVSVDSGTRGVLITGLNPLRPYDDAYEGFLRLVANQIASSVTNVRAYEDEHRRAEALADLNRVRQESANMLREETQTLETINRVGRLIASDLNLENVVEAVTEAATKVCGADIGAFFYTVKDETGESFTLFALSGASREDFAGFGMPRNTAVFAPTFTGTAIVRSDNILKDSRYGKNAPHGGMPKGHFPVVSYLAVPVISRSGEVLGGLFFGHKDEARFDDRAERLVAGIAAQAAIAMDNAQLFKSAQAELERRRKIEAHQKLLLDELNHRVKNTLATVQAVAAQTLRGANAGARDSFIARLFAMSSQHDLLTQDNWEGAMLEGVVHRALKPYQEEFRERFSVTGPTLQLDPKRALAFGMAFHELATNAAKYGALSSATGRINVSWAPDETGTVTIKWQESGGPPVKKPRHKGFGSRLIERGLSHEISGVVSLEYLPEGVICEWKVPP